MTYFGRHWPIQQSHNTRRDMTDNTPSTRAVRMAATNFDSAITEAHWDRWLAAHDQGIRDAVKPPAMTAEEYLEAAWNIAYPVSKGQVIPAGSPVMARDPDDGGLIYEPSGYRTDFKEDSLSCYERRTLTPLPPLIPDDCLAVWASTEDCDVRRIMMRSTVSPWGWLDSDGDTYDDDALIDPVPVPPESEARA